MKVHQGIHRETKDSSRNCTLLCRLSKNARLVISAALCISCCVSRGYARDPNTSSRPGRNAIGVSVGVPHTIALTYELGLTGKLCARGHAGTAVLLSSAGARIQYGSRGPGLRPYLFAGGVLIHATAEGFGDPEGTTGYVWFGPGVNIRKGRWTLYGEVSALLGGDDDSGLGDDWIFPFSPAVSAGIIVGI